MIAVGSESAEQLIDCLSTLGVGQVLTKFGIPVLDPLVEGSRRIHAPIRDGHSSYGHGPSAGPELDLVGLEAVASNNCSGPFEDLPG